MVPLVQHFCSCRFKLARGCQSWPARIKFWPFCLFMCLLTYLFVIWANILTLGLVQAKAVALYLYFDYTASQKAHKQAKLSKFYPGRPTLKAYSCFKSAATVMLRITLKVYWLDLNIIILQGVPLQYLIRYLKSKVASSEGYIKVLNTKCPCLAPPHWGSEGGWIQFFLIEAM